MASSSPSSSAGQPAPTSSRVISHERVLRCVYEFLDENGYHQSLRALQAESKIPYNVIHISADGAASGSGKSASKPFPPPSERGLEEAVMEGSWAEVLHVYVDGLLLPEEVKATLYEVILEEMVELHGLVPAARSLLLNAPIFQLMKVDTPARYIRLEKMIEHGQRTMHDGIASSTAATRRVTAEMRQRRTALLQQLKTAVRFTAEAPVGRLPAALARAAATFASSLSALSSGSGDAVHRPHQGGVSSAEDGARKRGREDTLPGDGAWADTFLQYPLTAPKEVRRRLPYADQQAASCCAPLLLAEERLLLVGRADGVVDVVDTENGAPRGNSLRHTEGVLSLARDTAEGVDAGPDWVAVGYRDGWVKIYNLESRKLVRRFERAHASGVTSLFFTGPRSVEGLSRHQSLLVTGSFDGAVRVLDVAAGAAVCTVANAHASAFVHALLPLSSVGFHLAPNRFCFLSSGNDGTVSLWRLEDGRAAETPTAVAVHRVQEALSLGQLHGELRDTVPTLLYGLRAPTDAPHGSAAAAAVAAAATSLIKVIATADVLLLTRAGKACVCRVSVQDEGSHYFTTAVQVLCIIATAHPLRSAFPHVHSVVSLSVPLLSLYAADSVGTVSLHNIEMKWHNAEQWADFGGCMKVREAADQSSVVIVEVGKAVRDLHVTCLWPPSQHQPSSVMAYGPSLPALYDIW